MDASDNLYEKFKTAGSTWIVGETGTAKSTLLAHIILDAIDSEQQVRGVEFMDAMAFSTPESDNINHTDLSLPPPTGHSELDSWLETICTKYGIEQGSRLSSSRHIHHTLSGPAPQYKNDLALWSLSVLGWLMAYAVNGADLLYIDNANFPSYSAVGKEATQLFSRLLEENNCMFCPTLHPSENPSALPTPNSMLVGPAHSIQFNSTAPSLIKYIERSTSDMDRDRIVQKINDLSTKPNKQTDFLYIDNTAKRYRFSYCPAKFARIIPRLRTSCSPTVYKKFARFDQAYYQLNTTPGMFFYPEGVSSPPHLLDGEGAVVGHRLDNVDVMIKQRLTDKAVGEAL